MGYTNFKLILMILIIIISHMEPYIVVLKGGIIFDIYIEIGVCKVYERQ